MDRGIAPAGYCPSGGNPATLKKYAALWNIGTDHFEPYAGVMERIRKSRQPLEQILIEHSTYSRSNLKQRLYEEGLKEPRCEMCRCGDVGYPLRACKGNPAASS